MRSEAPAAEGAHTASTASFCIHTATRTMTAEQETQIHMEAACGDGLNVWVMITAVHALVAEQRWDSGRHGGGVYLHLPSPAEVLNVVFADVVIEK